jgi:hypothetical protein
MGRPSNLRIVPRDVAAHAAAARLGLSLAEFESKLPNFVARGFPRPDPDTGLFDMVAIEKWCDARHPHLFGGGSLMQARDEKDVVRDRIESLRVRRG